MILKICLILTKWQKISLIKHICSNGVMNKGSQLTRHQRHPNHSSQTAYVNPIILMRRCATRYAGVKARVLKGSSDRHLWLWSNPHQNRSPWIRFGSTGVKAHQNSTVDPVDPGPPVQVKNASAPDWEAVEERDLSRSWFSPQRKDFSPAGSLVPPGTSEPFRGFYFGITQQEHAGSLEVNQQHWCAGGHDGADAPIPRTFSTQTFLLQNLQNPVSVTSEDVDLEGQTVLSDEARTACSLVFLSNS